MNSANPQFARLYARVVRAFIVRERRTGSLTHNQVKQLRDRMRYWERLAIKHGII